MYEVLVCQWRDLYLLQGLQKSVRFRERVVYPEGYLQEGVEVDGNADEVADEGTRSARMSVPNVPVAAAPGAVETAFERLRND